MEEQPRMRSAAMCGAPHYSYRGWGMTFVHKPTQLTTDLLYLNMNATILLLEMLCTQLFVHKLEGIV